METLVNVYRGGLLESFHSGSIAVVSSSGRLIAYAGDPSLTTYLRSAAKPFQAIPLLQEGGREEFDLSSEEIALICASHGGEPHHVSTAAAILRKGDFDEDDLLCGIHTPYDEKAAADLKSSSEAASVLHSNCSGKHGGMLMATRLLEVPSTNYVAGDHPLQKRIVETLARFAGVETAEIPQAIDGCSVPSYYMSIYRAAFAYARLGALGRGNSGTHRGLEPFAEAATSVVDAMTAHPEYVAGNWSLTTPLMRAFNGQLLAKEGAEGFYAMSILPGLADQLIESLGTSRGETIGIALKAADGSMSRGRDAVIFRTLEQLGVPVPDPAMVHKFSRRQLKNVSGIVVGEVRAEFTLRFL